MMEKKYKTEVGPIMEAMSYMSSEVEKWDDIAFQLYCAPASEQREHIAALLWFLFGDDCMDGDYPREYFKNKFKKFNNILTERNK